MKSILPTLNDDSDYNYAIPALEEHFLILAMFYSSVWFMESKLRDHFTYPFTIRKQQSEEIKETTGLMAKDHLEFKSSVPKLAVPPHHTLKE